MSFNKIILVGNLGRDPELRYTPQGDAVCSFSIATNEKKKDKSGEFQDVTTWFKVTLWRRQAENANKYLSKGSSVYIEGRLGLEEWTDREGKERYTLAVQGTEMQFIGSRGDNAGGGGYSGGGQDDHDSGFTGAPQQQSSAPAASAPSTPVAAPQGDDDIPF
jgi:single-strand DNA-binding protein